MSETPEPQAEALSLEEVARAAQDLATRPDAAGVAAAFLEVVQRWAAPSAVLSAVRDPQGRRTGTFNSIWRLEGDGKWRIIFDNGCPPCGGG